MNKKTNQFRWNTVKPYLYLLPSFLLLVIFYYYAVVYAFQLSLTDTILGLQSSFVGLKNYIRLFEDPIFKRSISNLVILAVASLVKGITFPLLAAELLYFVRHKWSQDLAKRVFIFPLVVPGMVITMIWYNMLDPSIGLVNQILGKIGLESWQHSWFFDEKTAIWSVLVIGFPWIAGMNFLIFHNALNDLDEGVREAAEIDGCTSLGLVRYIHLPALVPYVGTVATLSVIGSLQDYGSILVTTNGGPGYATYVPALIMYNNMTGEIGYAASAGVFCFALILVVTSVIRALTKMADKS